MTGSTDRRLSNAPVIYVLGQIRFNTILKMADRVADIQEDLRKEFPKYNRDTIRSLQVSGPIGGDPVVEQAEEIRWQFNNKDSTSGFILRESDLVFHTSAHTVFEDFLASVQKGVSSLVKHAEVDLLNRVGLRYVNYFAPDNGVDIAEFVRRSVRGIPLENLGIDPVGSMQKSETHVLTAPDTHLVVKFSQGNHQGMLPAELMPLSIVQPRQHDTSVRTGILDIDHYWTGQEDFSEDLISKKFSGLHETTSATFREVVTKEGLKQWQ